MTKKKLGGFLGALAGIAAAIIAAKQPHHSAPAPVPSPGVPLYTLTVHVCDDTPCEQGNEPHKVPAASIAVTDNQALYVTDGAGNVDIPTLPAGRYHVCVAATGYVEACRDQAVPAGGPLFVVLAKAVPVLAAVHLDWRTLRLADGRQWNWRYATAFTILAQPDAAQDAFLAWAAGRGLNGVRILTTAKLLADLPPEQGRARLPAFLEKLRQRGMGAEVVALADTAARGMSRDDMRAHVAGVAGIVAGVPIPLTLELANENAHETQQRDLQDVAFLHELRALVPASIPVSLGSSCCGQSDTAENYPGGDYSTPHMDRSRPMFQEVARVKHLIEDFRQFVADDEGIGAAEANDPGKRNADPSRFFAQGVLDRLGGLGSTFHFQNGLTATVPGPTSDACADAFVAGATIAPEIASFRFVNDSAADGITHGADWSHVYKLFGFINSDPSGPSYLVALGVTGELVATYGNGWHAVRVAAERPGVQVIEVRQ